MQKQRDRTDLPIKDKDKAESKLMQKLVSIQVVQVQSCKLYFDYYDDDKFWSTEMFWVSAIKAPAATGARFSIAWKFLTEWRRFA